MHQHAFANHVRGLAVRPRVVENGVVSASTFDVRRRACELVGLGILIHRIVRDGAASLAAMIVHRIRIDVR